MANHLLLLAAILQALAVAYGVLLLSRRQGAAAAWLFLLGAMLSMLVWRIVVVSHVDPPAFFNPLIAIWGSSCMVGAMFFFGREVALRNRAEMQRDALLDSERAARAEAERANRLKDDFLATLSHELRTPLAAILGWCTVMRGNGARPEDMERAIDVIQRNARAQRRLIDDLLDVTRLQAGNLHLEFATLALQAPVRAAIQDVRLASEAKGVAIDFHDQGALQWVRGDAGRLQQIASNLLVNAVKFTPAGGRITVSVAERGARAVLEVADTGEGIDAAFLPHVFERFRQADGTTARSHGGLGLGLSIVAQLAKLHGGEVQAASPGRGCGATFTVALPLAEEDGQSPALTAASGDAVEPVGLSGISVLLVDDEADVRESVSRMLQSLGADVVALPGAAGVEDAIARQRPDVLLIDISMPGEDGYSLIRRIRGLPEPAGGIPAISLTAHARDADRTLALDAGFQRHQAKPVDLPALASAIRDLATLRERR